MLQKPFRYTSTGQTCKVYISRILCDLTGVLKTNEKQGSASHSLGHCRLDLCPMPFDKTRLGKNRIRWRAAWNAQRRGPRQHFPRSLQGCRICRHWHGQVQISHRFRTGCFQQPSLLHESCQRGFYWNYDSQVHQKGTLFLL